MFSGSQVIVSFVYALVSFSLIAPPDVLLATGLTLENIFFRFLGSEEINFIDYHLRRTTLVTCFLSSLPFGYFVALHYFGSLGFLNGGEILPNPTSWLGVAMTLSAAFSAAVCAYVYLAWYSRGSWSGHPAVLRLQSLYSILSSDQIVWDEFSTAQHRSFHDEPWRCLAAWINRECRSLEKFIAFGGRGLTSSWPGRRLIATASWLLYAHLTDLRILYQAGHCLKAVVVSTGTLLDLQTNSSDGHPVGEDLSAQTMATVRVLNTESAVCLLTFTIPARELDALQMHLRFELVLAQGVVLEPTVVQQFLVVFNEVVNENRPFTQPDSMELEPCIGCMNQNANVILLRGCGTSREVSPTGCGHCNCRPMWCVTCLGRWFASRMTEAKKPTSEWLLNKAPCPTCRETFCARDVAIILPRA